MTTMTDVAAKLAEPTPFDEIRFVPQNVDVNERTALALPYYDARFVQQRLDDSCGPFGWQSDIKEVKGFVCVGIGIIDPESSRWLWKWDTGQEEQGQAVDADDDEIGGAKAIVSRGIKRAGVQWGIGRDVYGMAKKRKACDLRQGKGGKMVFARWTRSGAASSTAIPQPPPAGPFVVEDATATSGLAPLPTGDRKKDSAAFADLAMKHHVAQDTIAEIIQRNVGDDNRTDWQAALKDLEAHVAKNGAA